MAVDPNTGLYSLDVNYQPTGALGAVISLLNSQKANEIAQTLQQQREAQAQYDEQRANDLASAATRHAAGRAAQAALSPDTTPDQRITAALPFEDLKDVLPYYSRIGAAETRAGGLTDVANINAGAKRYSTDVNAGVTGAPVPTARAANLTASGEEHSAKAKRIADMTPAEIAGLGSLSALRRAEAQYYQIRTSLDKVDLKDPEYKNLMDRKKVVDANITGLLKSMGHLMEDPQTQGEIEDLQAEKKDLERKITLKEAARGAKTSGVADPSTYTPFSSTSPGPGTAAPASIAPAAASSNGNPLGLNLGQKQP